jgi:DNA polymerase I-like protein with 3'-5' exonuclease and polymerase domains
MKGTGRIITADSEAIGLLWDIRKNHPEDMHIIHAKDWETGEKFDFFDDFDDRENAVWLDDFEEGYKAGTLAEGIEFLRTAEVLIMQNIAGFDALAFEKATGSFKRNHFEARGKSAYKSGMFPYKTMDTAVMSRVLNPERKLPPQAYSMGIKLPGPHTIEAHGIRMGRFKPKHEDWSHLSKEMIHRCSEDVEIGEDFYKYLWKEWVEHLARPNKMTGLNISHAYYCEFRMAFTVARQEQRGFAVDVGFMVDLLEELDTKIDATEKAFRPHMPQRIKKKKLNPAQVEKMLDAMAEIPGVDYASILKYEQELDKLDYRGSYATTYWNLTTKKGAYLKNVTKYIPKARGFAHEYGDNPPVHGPFTPVVWEDIPLGNRDVVKQILYRYGWRGVNYNDTELEFIEDNDGKLPVPWAGKIDSDSIDKWEESGHTIPEWCKGIAEWYVLMSRRNQILNRKDPAYFDKNGAWPKQQSGNKECRGLMAQAICFDEDSQWFMKRAQEHYALLGYWPSTGHWRVPAKAFHAATNTFRMSHKVVVNIPSRGLYGKEMRRIFIAGPGKMILGCDGAGLELRMLAHFMNDPDYQEIILNGDIHTHNQQLAGLSKRDYAKTFIYAFLYGSGIPNLARQLGLTFAIVEKAVSRFKRELPKLTSLLERVEAAGKRFGYMLAVDGRWGRIRSRGGDLLLHTALNVLLQMTGSLVMKWAHVRAEDQCEDLGIIDSIDDFPIVAHVHDEGQMEVDADKVEEFTYEISKDDWKTEEKKEYFDSLGRMWSAPKIIDEAEEAEGLVKLLIRRRYHPIGEQYCKALEWAGQFLKLRCPTAGEYMIGDSWAETH